MSGRSIAMGSRSRWIRFGAPFGAGLFVALSAGPSGAATLHDLPLGIERSEVLRTVEEAGWRHSRFERRTVRVEGDLVPELFLRQSALLAFDDEERLSRIDVALWPPGGSDGRDLLRFYEDLGRTLSRYLGPAAWEEASGSAPSRELLVALRDGRVVRYLQWDGPPPVRAGIPLRTDGRVVLQILVTAEPPDRGRRLWGRDDF